MLCNTIRFVGLTALTACGYGFSAGGGRLPGEASALAVPIFENATSEAQLGALFTGALREALVGRGRLAADDGHAPRVFGTVFSVSGGGSALGAGTRVGAFVVTARIKVRVEQEGRVLFADDVTGSEDYLPGVDILGTEASRRAALQRLARSLMERALERMQR